MASIGFSNLPYYSLESYREYMKMIKQGEQLTPQAYGMMIQGRKKKKKKKR